MQLTTKGVNLWTLYAWCVVLWVASVLWPSQAFPTSLCCTFDNGAAYGVGSPLGILIKQPAAGTIRRQCFGALGAESRSVSDVLGQKNVS